MHTCTFSILYATENFPTISIPLKKLVDLDLFWIALYVKHLCTSLQNAAVQTKFYKSSFSILILLVLFNILQCFEFSAM